MGTFRRVFVVASTMTCLLAMPSMNHCLAEDRTLDGDVYHAHPVKVVVQPWLGQHHVFGVFVVPMRYRSGKNYQGMLSVLGFQDALAPDWQPLERRMEGHTVAQEHYLIRGYIPTRFALWLVLTGQFKALRDPHNWTLEFSRTTNTMEAEKR
jgi:hypothetical protein